MGAGINRTGPSSKNETPSPYKYPQECDGLWKDAQQFDADAVTCKGRIAGMESLIRQGKAQAEECRQRINAIERDIQSERNRREYWNRTGRGFSEEATRNQRVLEDRDRKVRSASEKSSQLKSTLENASSPEDKAKIQKQIDDNNAQLQNLTSEQTEARTIRDNADRLKLFSGEQFKVSENYEATTLNANRQKETANLGIENYKIEEMAKDVSQQHDLLKQAEKAYNDKMNAWMACVTDTMHQART